MSSTERERFSLSAAGSSYLPSVERSALPYDSSVRGPRKFAICGESGGCCRSNDKVILCDLHTERDAQFVGIVVIKNGIYIPVDTCCHYQFCFALQMRQSCISLEQKQNLSLN